MKKHIKVAVVQYHPSDSAELNLKKIEEFIDKCKKQGTELLVLPEYCVASIAEINNGYQAFQKISNLSSHYQIYLAGANPKKEQNGKTHNIGFLADPNGKIIAEHKKICLAPPEIEEGRLTSGTELRVYNTPLGKIGLLVCKDSFNRFSSWLFQDLRKLGAEIIIIPTWSIDASPRALSLCRDGLIANCNWSDAYLLVSGTVGKYADYSCFGHSMIICPRRGVLAEGSREKEELLAATVDEENLQWIQNYDRKWQPDKIFKYEVVK